MQVTKYYCDGCKSEVPYQEHLTLVSYVIFFKQEGVAATHDEHAEVYVCRDCLAELGFKEPVYSYSTSNSIRTPFWNSNKVFKMILKTSEWVKRMREDEEEKTIKCLVKHTYRDTSNNETHSKILGVFDDRENLEQELKNEIRKLRKRYEKEFKEALKTEPNYIDSYEGENKFVLDVCVGHSKLHIFEIEEVVENRLALKDAYRNNTN